MKRENLEKNLAALTNILYGVLKMEVGVSGEAEDYTLDYIAQKLARTTQFMERLSYISTSLAQQGIRVVEGVKGAKALLKLKTSEFMECGSYRDHKNKGQGKIWLEAQLAPFHVEASRWETLEKAINQVTNAVAEKTQTLRRIDSALRLQEKILEHKKTSGPPMNFEDIGTDVTPEIDIA